MFTVPGGTSVLADVYMFYTLRHVSAGGDTYEEKDDDTLDRTVGPVRRRATLISGSDAGTAGYAVQVGEDGGKLVSAQQGGRSVEGRCFASQLDGMDFIAYMADPSVTPRAAVGGYALGLIRPETGTTAPVPLTRAEAGSPRLHPGC